MLKKIIIMILLCLASDVYSEWADYEYNLLNPIVTFDYVGSSIPAYAVNSGTSVYANDAGLLQGQSGAYWVSIATTATPAPDLSGYAIRDDVITSTNSLQNQINAVQQSTYTVGSIQHELLQSTGTITHAQIETSLNNIGVSTGSIQSVISQIQIDTGTLSAVKLDTTTADSTYLTKSSATATYAYNDKDYAYLNSAQTFNSSVTINAALLVGTTLTVDVIKAWEIHVSTIVGRSPVKFDGAIKLSDDTLLTSTAAFAAAASYSLTTDTASYAWNSDKLDNQDSTVFLTTVTADSTYLTKSSATATYAYNDKDYAYLSSTQMFTGMNTFNNNIFVISSMTPTIEKDAADSTPLNFICSIATYALSGYSTLTATMTSNTTPSPNVCDQSSVNGAQTASRAFAKSNAGWWVSAVGAQYLPAWISYTNGVSTFVVNSYAIQAPSVADVTGLPRNWVFQGGQSSTTWVDLDTREDETGWVAFSSKTYVFDNTTGYKWYRLYVTSTTNNTYVWINELSLYNTPTTISVSTYTIKTTSVGGFSSNVSLDVLYNDKSKLAVGENYIQTKVPTLIGETYEALTSTLTVVGGVTIVGETDIQAAPNRGVLFDKPSSGYGTGYTIYGLSDGFSYATLNLSDIKDLSLTAAKNWQINFRAIDGRIIFFYNDEVTDPGGSSPILGLLPNQKVFLGEFSNTVTDTLSGATLLVRGNLSTAADSALDIQNSNGLSLFNVRDDGRVGVQTSTNTIAGLFQVGGGSLTVMQNGYIIIGSTTPSTKFAIHNGSVTITGTNANLIADGFVQTSGVQISTSATGSYIIGITTPTVLFQDAVNIITYRRGYSTGTANCWDYYTP